MLCGRPIVEINATKNTLVRSYVWGLDLSGTMNGAGGVGGFEWVTLHTASGSASGTHCVCYDGNGNIVSLVNVASGDVTGRYEYGPFGEPIRISGPAATLNPFRFSTKRTDPTTDLVLYEYRAYSPTLGRWLNRDPIEESGGRNLYGFVYNNPIRRIDRLGLFVETCPGALKAIAARCACRAAAAGTTGSAGGPLAAIACVAAAVAAELVAMDVALAMEVAALEKQNEQDAQKIDEKSRE
jgi:RHS repeat-associated protein